MEKLVIIGGGAAGLAAAVTAALELRACGIAVGVDGVEVAVCEADERVGRSILATGNGRCNFSNAHVCSAVYRGAGFVDTALSELREGSAQGGDPVCAFFSDLGLVWREETEGRLYPMANKATSVLEVLRAAARDAGVLEACEREATRIDAPQQVGECLHVRFADGTVLHTKAAIVAVGGKAVERLLLPDGFVREPGYPVLGPLRTDTRVVRALNNIRVRCSISLVSSGGVEKAREQGELLFRDYGVSGIAVFNLSRFAEEGDELHVDFAPCVDADVMEDYLLARCTRLTSVGRPCNCEAVLRGMLLPAVAQAVLREAGLDPEAPFDKGNVLVLARALKGLVLKVRGVGEARQCQVTRGGFAVEAFDARTMEARMLPGLYVVGEALDVDGPCGGFNLHWAWASGILAGRAAAMRIAQGIPHA